MVLSYFGKLVLFYLLWWITVIEENLSSLKHCRALSNKTVIVEALGHFTSWNLDILFHLTVGHTAGDLGNLRFFNYVCHLLQITSAPLFHKIKSTKSISKTFQPFPTILFCNRLDRSADPGVNMLEGILQELVY